MKHLSMGVVLITFTIAGFAFRGNLARPTEASLDREGPANRARAVVPASTERPRDDDSSVVSPVSNKLTATAEKSADRQQRGDVLGRELARDGELALARIAAECGDYLLVKARNQPDGLQLLAQASAHYRACLSHESSAVNAGALFDSVRTRLGEVERRQRAASTPKAPATAVQQPVDEKPHVGPPLQKKAPTTPTFRNDEAKMVGPDGVQFRRVGER
jgi:hypothetical protein